ANALADGRTIKAHESIIGAVAFSPDGKRLASVSTDYAWDEVKNGVDKKPGAAQVHLWDLVTGQRVLSLKNPDSSGMNVAFSPDGKQLITVGQDGTIRFWDTGTGQEVRGFKEKSGIGNLAFSPDGRTVLFGSPDGIKIIDAATGKELMTSKDGLNMAGGIN